MLACRLCLIHNNVSCNIGLSWCTEFDGNQRTPQRLVICVFRWALNFVVAKIAKIGIQLESDITRQNFIFKKVNKVVMLTICFYYCLGAVVVLIIW